MKLDIKYKKVDFNHFDILISIVLFFSGVFIFYLIYKFCFLKKIKKKVEIKLLDDVLFISGNNINKKIKYEEIRTLIIKKNIFSSYDIMFNFDETLCIFRNLSNYLIDFSMGNNHSKSYIICDVMNINEVSEKILSKLNFMKLKECKNVDRLYLRYSLIEKLYPVVFIIISIFWLLLENKSYVVIFLIISCLRLFKKKYEISVIDDKLKIYEKNAVMYANVNFYEKNNSLILEYNFKNSNLDFNLYYLTYGIMPKKYKK